MKVWQYALALGLIVAALVLWRMSVSTESVTSSPPPVSPEVTGLSQEEYRSNPLRKDVNARVTVGTTYASPSELTVGTDDRVFLYVRSLDETVTLVESLRGGQIVVPAGEERILTFIAYADTTVSCIVGCEPGVAITVTAT